MEIVKIPKKEWDDLKQKMKKEEILFTRWFFLIPLWFIIWCIINYFLM
jgi:TRAP-type uncharacterized transport system fused permease subunit